MPEFLAETYTPREVLDTAAPRAGDLARAAAHAGGPGAPVCFLGAIAVPGEETCFWLYPAPRRRGSRRDDRRRAGPGADHPGGDTPAAPAAPGPAPAAPAVLSRPPAGMRGMAHQGPGCGERFTEEERTS